jgi:hypothetical protein
MLRKFAFFALAALFPVPVLAQGLVEYALVLCLVGPGPSQNYELCASNRSDVEQTTTFLLDSSGSSARVERIELRLGPGDTDCQLVSPTGPGTISEVVAIPTTRAGQGHAEIHRSEVLRLRSQTVTQVWLTDEGGKRTAVVGGTGFQYGETDSREYAERLY